MRKSNYVVNANFARELKGQRSRNSQNRLTGYYKVDFNIPL